MMEFIAETLVMTYTVAGGFWGILSIIAISIIGGFMIGYIRSREAQKAERGSSLSNRQQAMRPKRRR